MEYNNALSQYNAVVNKLDEQIEAREMRIVAARDKIKEIKDKRKEEIRQGIFSNVVKKFTRSSELTALITEIEVATVELEALQELRSGDDPNLINAAKQLSVAAFKEAERLREVRRAKEREIEELQETLNNKRNEVYGFNDGSEAVLNETTIILDDILKAQFPDKYEKFTQKGYAVALLDKLAE